MLRSVKLSLKFATAKKLRQLQAIEVAYRQAVNYFVPIFYATGNQPNLVPYKIVGSRLTPKYLAVAHKHATKIVSTAKATGQVEVPKYKGGINVADQQMSFKKVTELFDLVAAVSSLVDHHKIHLPLKKTKPLVKWLAVPGAVLKTGGIINTAKKQIILYIEIPDQPLKTEGKLLGVDIGINKLVVDSTGNQYGTEIKRLCQKVARRKPGSKNKRQARTERDQYINRVVKQLPWSELKCIGVENLTGMKAGKKPGRSRKFRRQTAPWSYRQVTTRLQQKAELNRVQFILVDPKYTSQSCPNCGNVSKDNRNGQSFKCVSCGHIADADHVGALNVAARAAVLANFRELEVP